MLYVVNSSSCSCWKSKVSRSLLVVSRVIQVYGSTGLLPSFGQFFGSSNTFGNEMQFILKFSICQTYDVSGCVQESTHICYFNIGQILPKLIGRTCPEHRFECKHSQLCFMPCSACTHLSIAEYLGFKW